MRAWRYLVIIMLAGLAALVPALALSVSDTQPPTVVGLSFAPHAIDTVNAFQSVTFTAHLADNLSGVASSLADFRSPSGRQYQLVSFDSYQLVSGNSLDGVYISSMIMPKYSESGAWQLQSLRLTDQASNTRYMTKDELLASGFPVTLTVAPGGDITPPGLVSFTLSPPVVNTALSSQTITFTASFTDDLSGVLTERWQSEACFNSTSAPQRACVVFASWDLDYGNALDGTFVSDLILPQYSASGLWQMDVLWIYDAVGNTRMLPWSDLANLGFPTSFMVAPGGDAGPPSLIDFDFDPKTVDVSHGPESITLQLHLTDDQSGVENFGSSRVFFVSPSGRQSTVAFIGPDGRISGDSKDGIYIVQMPLSPFSEPGTWHLDTMWLTDNVWNHRYLHQADLQALGFPTSFDLFNTTERIRLPLVNK